MSCHSKNWLFIVFLLAILAQSSVVQGNEYQYKLEGKVSHRVCSHMTLVFNKNFRNLWDKGYLGQDPNPVTKGTPLNEVFERLPGVEYVPGFTFEMLYSKYPSSPEFEAIIWKEGRYCSRSGSLTCDSILPVLISEFDIDNDGKKNWVIKYAFKKNILTWESQNGFGDELVIFNLDQFDPSVKINTEDLVGGQVPNGYPRTLNGELLRPFLFDGEAYIASYQYAGNKKKSKAEFLIPQYEHMNILRVISVSQNLPPLHTSKLNTETICSIRMINNPHPKKKGS